MKPIQTLKSKEALFLDICNLQIKSCWILFLSGCLASLGFFAWLFKNAFRIEMAIVNYCFFCSFPCALLLVGNGSRIERLPLKLQREKDFKDPKHVCAILTSPLCHCRFCSLWLVLV